MHHVYISYAHSDEAFALELANDLRLTGPRVWVGIQQVQSGDDWTASIEQALSEAQMMVVILSPDAIDTPGVAAEWKTYLELFRPVIPVIAQPCNPPEELQMRRPIDFTRDYRKGLNQLVIRLIEYRARNRTADAVMGGLAEKVQGFRDEQKPPASGTGIRRAVHDLYGRLRGG
jgi:hypothetical protein